MFRKAFSLGGVLAIALTVVLLTVEPAQAARPGGYYHGGFYGGYHNFDRPYYGGYGGYHSPYYGSYGYRPYYGSRHFGYQGYYPSYGYYPRYSHWR